MTGRAVPRSGSVRRATDLAWRGVYWAGYRVLRQWWRLRRLDQHGALVAVWLDGRILMVRSSYRRELSFPGGTIGPGEDPREAARRELGEEVGLHVAAERLVLAHESVHDWEYRRDHVRVFELRLMEAPALVIDNREVVGATFMDPVAVLRAPVPPHVRSYLLEAG